MRTEPRRFKGNMYTIFGQKSIIQVSCGESVPQRQDLRTPDQIADDFLAWSGLEGERAATVRADIIAREAWLAEMETREASMLQAMEWDNEDNV